MGYDDLTEFLEQSNFIEDERSQQAHDDAREAWNYINRWFNVREKLGLAPKKLPHYIVLGVHYNLLWTLRPEIAGLYRTGPVAISGCDRDLPSEVLVRPLMQDLLDGPDPTTEEEIKDWHIRFEHIHPFFDGNGRTGRIIMNWQRVKAGLPLLIIHEGAEQMEYYRWFL